MNRLGLISLILSPLLSFGQTLTSRQPTDVASFAVNDTSAIRALLTLSHAQKLPLGIIESDNRLCTTSVKYSGERKPLAMIVSGIVAQVPGYKTIESNGVMLVLPDSVPAVTKQFLELVDPHFGPIRGNVQMLSASLWVHVRYLLHPNEGTALSVLSSPGESLIEMDKKQESIEEILTDIALRTSGVWIVRPLPDSLQKIGTDLPFLIFSELGSSASEDGDLCAPVSIANGKGLYGSGNLSGIR